MPVVPKKRNEVGKKMKDKKLSGIYESKDYDKFVEDLWYVSGTRVELLKMKLEKGELLPLVEVEKRDDEQLEIIGDQDSFYVSKELRLPVRYYFSYRDENSRYKQRHKVLPTNTELQELINYVSYNHRARGLR